MSQVSAVLKWTFHERHTAVPGYLGGQGFFVLDHRLTGFDPFGVGIKLGNVYFAEVNSSRIAVPGR